MHEPGPQTVVGKVYPAAGVEQGRAVLADLARHPATAAHVARKLARHFVADEPPPALVERLAKRFLDTDGDLKEIAKALVEAPETWDEQRAKLKRPSEWLISAWRAIGVVPDARARPAGAWPISASGCGGRPRRRASPTSSRPGSTGSRSGSTSRTASPSWCRRGSSRTAFVETALGPLASAETRQTIARAESRQQALTLR